MELLNIRFKKGEEGANPNEITVELSIKEAIWIQSVINKTRYSDKPEGIGECLRGDVFNRYWEDGLDDAMREIGDITIPPIIYPNVSGHLT